MMKSMTGYGKAQNIIDGREISVEIRSVNHRYFEFNARLPRNYNYIEEKLKNLLHEKICRGKVEVSVSLNNIENSDYSVQINKPVAEAYYNALLEISGSGTGLSVDEKFSGYKCETYFEDDLTLSTIMKLPDIFIITKKADDEEKIWDSVRITAEKALESFMEMRETEGGRLADDISKKLSNILEMVGKIEVLEPQSVKAYHERLFKKLTEIIGSGVDEQRILTECAVFSDKVAVDEETVRLKSHIEQVLCLIDSDEPVGKKIDFIIQEMNREVNTIGSKSQSIDITKIVVELKSEIEKIREQIQNVE